MSGPPSGYTQALVDEICERISCGETLRQICAENAHMPDKKTILRWKHKHEDFSEKFIAAMRVRDEMAAEDLREIDDQTLEMVQYADVTRISAIVQAQKMRSDNRKWTAARMSVRLYGDKLQHTGEGGGAIEAAVTVTFVKAQHGDGSQG